MVFFSKRDESPDSKMVEMDAAIRWSPHAAQTGPEFVLLDVNNSGIALHQLRSIDKSKVESTETVSYNKLPNYAAFDWSRTTARVISLGHVSGTASVHILKPGAPTLETRVLYKAKQQRRCNATAFNAQDWLAVGLDKARTDFSLNIYDVASTSSDPIRKLCSAETISSVRFFNNQPHELLAGAQRAVIRLYDLRDGFAGGPGSLLIPSRNVNNISIDPLDENYFVAGGSQDDPSVVVWDKRWLTNSANGADNVPVFDFRPALDNTSRASVWSMRFSGRRRGRLAFCSSRGELKLVDLLEDSIANAASPEQQAINNASALNRKRVRETRVLEPPCSIQRNGLPSADSVVAFDWMPAADTEVDQNLLVLRASRTISAVKVASHRAIAFSALGAITMSARNLTVIAAAEHTTSTGQHDTAKDDISGPLQDLVVTAETAPASHIEIQSILTAGDIHHTRCKQGYRFDCRKNAAIVRGNKQLERLWESIEQLRTLAANDGMVYESLDFSFVGVNGLWSEHAGTSPQRRLSVSPTKPVDAITGLNDRRELPGFEGARTDYAEHRQICLAVCGWKFSAEDLEAECQGLIERGLYYQAIVQAVLHGSKHLALNLLRTLIRGKTIQNIGLGALLAADELNEEQREMTSWMAADTEDLALKALLTYLHSGDWRDVMKTTYLHLGYRLALGLKYLNDTELNGFIQSETARAIKNGDLEGILLTGLTEQAMDLFQVYIAKTNDLQTAVVAMAITNPLYVDDPRWSMWKETYFMQMQAWHAFAERMRFMAEHNRMARTREGRTLNEPMVPIAKLRCVHCQKELGRKDVSDPQQKGRLPKTSQPSKNAGIICLECGRHLPRCSICTLWLGEPDPRRARPLAKSKTGDGASPVANMLVFCTKCNHGSHADHAREWFAEHNVCPVPECACNCNNGAAKEGLSTAQLWQAGA